MLLGVAPISILACNFALGLDPLGTGVTVVSGLVVIAGWFVSRGLSAVVGEYAKRIWFRRLWRDEVQRARRELANVAAIQERQQAEYQSLISLAEKISLENDRLWIENIRLRRPDNKREAG